MGSASGVIVLGPMSRLRPSPPMPDLLDLSGFGILDLSGFGILEEIDASDCADGENDWATDEFLFDRRMSFPSSPVEFSWARAVDMDLEALRVDDVVVFSPDPEGGEGRDLVGSGNLGLSPRLACLRLGEHRRDPNEEFEWEEVDGRFEERDALGVAIIGDEERSEEFRDLDRNQDGAQWEVLLSVNNLARQAMEPDDVETYFVDEQEGLIHNEEFYDVLFAELTEQDSNIKCNPPAARSVIESLPSVTFSKEDLAKDGAACAVCKEEILVYERIKRLPCSHLYHEGCILPWLGIRNTCPLCRFELPTDDPEYEKWKARREEPFFSDHDLQLRYDFEVLPEA